MVDYEKLGVFYLGREVDAGTGEPTDTPLLYDARDLTTHAVVVGMTGSGKTGLCVSLLEEAAIDGIPALVIDPKGDIANLLLTFPELRGADFAPWVDEGEATRQGLSRDALAEKTAQQWRDGLQKTGQAPERIAKFRDAVDIAIYTPGSDTGLPLSVVRSFAPPPAGTDGGALRDRVGAVVGGLLGLLGIDADPLTSREYILLATVVENAWKAGQTLDLAGLIQAVQKPGVEKVGVFDLETFFPAKDRLKLAMALNGLLASPGFAAWMQGEPLDIQRLLFTPAGKPRISVVSIAHLNDAERMFIVALLLNEVVSWMRAQSGTSSLRALVYMDEVAGYFPPVATPPSKAPMLLLLKQARAFGLGVVLATQNPVDLDYKGLGNTGTWFIGRLQTERDKARVLEGLESALGGALTREQLDGWMSGLKNRTFLMRNVHDDGPVLMRARWALSYLRGPLAGPEIAKLMAARKAQGAAPAAAPAAAATAAAAPAPKAAARPAVPAALTEVFLAPESGNEAGLSYRPAVCASVKLHYVDAKSKLDTWATQTLLAPLSDDGKAALWAEAQPLDFTQRARREPAAGAAFGDLPAGAVQATAATAWGKQLAAHAYENLGCVLQVCDALKQVSLPGESAGDFRARLGHIAREGRDAALEALRKKYAVKLQSAEDQVRRAEERHDRESAQVTQQGLQTALSVGATVLGALFGRKTMSSSTVGRATTAARSAGRVASERQDAQRAAANVEVERQQLADLNAQVEAETAALAATYSDAALELRELRVAPRKTDIAVANVALAWVPYRSGADGFPVPA